MTEFKMWRRLPTGWIGSPDFRLRDLTWAKGAGANNAAALMLLAVITHHSDDDGVSRITYDAMSLATGLSRAKIAAGLGVLRDMKLVQSLDTHRSDYQLVGYDREKGWAILPARPLYSGGQIKFFHRLNLRQRTELDCLKLYFLIIARRDRKANRAYLTYDQMSDYTSIDTSRIKSALSLLSVNDMLLVDQIQPHEKIAVPQANREFMSHAYRIPSILPYRHMGTTSRAADGAEVAEAIARQAA